MTTNPHIYGGTFCNYCGQRDDHMISVYMASGDIHICQKCWPSRREYFEDERTWKRVGDRFIGTWDWEDYPYLRG